MGDLTGGHPQSTPQVHLRDTATVALEGQDTQRLKKHDISAPRIVIFNVLFLPFPDSICRHTVI